MYNFIAGAVGDPLIVTTTEPTAARKLAMRLWGHSSLIFARTQPLQGSAVAKKILGHWSGASEKEKGPFRFHFSAASGDQCFGDVGTTSDNDS